MNAILPNEFFSAVPTGLAIKEHIGKTVRDVLQKFLATRGETSEERGAR